MGNFIFIIGGMRSGKSSYAQALAKETGKKVTFIATCIPEDEEMKRRVALHKKARPKNWRVIEEPRNIKAVLQKNRNKSEVLIIDCLGLLISNFLAAGRKESVVKKDMELIASILSKSKNTSIVVSNEVGAGLVPTNPLARKFADLLGLTNQIMARYADNVCVMQAGIPMAIKKRINNEKIK